MLPRGGFDRAYRYPPSFHHGDIAMVVMATGFRPAAYHPMRCRVVYAFAYRRFSVDSARERGNLRKMVGMGLVGAVNIDEMVGVAQLGKHIQMIEGEIGDVFPIEPSAWRAERKRYPRRAEQRRLPCRARGAGIDNIGAQIGAVIDSRDDDVEFARDGPSEGKRNAIGGRPSGAVDFIRDLADHNGRFDANCVRAAALVVFWSHNPDVVIGCYNIAKGGKSGACISVVVGYQYSHNHIIRYFAL